MKDADLPFRYEATVIGDWMDYNGHMTEYSYHYLFAEAITEFFEGLGLGAARLEATGRTFYTGENHVTFRSEVRLGENVVVLFRLLGSSHNALYLYAEMEDATGGLLATYESLVLHILQEDGRPRVTRFDDTERNLAETLVLKSRALPPPRVPTGRVGPLRAAGAQP